MCPVVYLLVFSFFSRFFLFFSCIVDVCGKRGGGQGSKTLKVNYGIYKYYIQPIKISRLFAYIVIMFCRILAGVTSEQPDLLGTAPAKYRVVEYYRVCRFRDVTLEYTYFFIICFENLHLGIPSTHTYIPVICVGHNLA
jgi:hypothetical protein